MFRILLIITGIGIVAYMVYKALNKPVTVTKENYTPDELNVRRYVTKKVWIDTKCMYTKNWLMEATKQPKVPNNFTEQQRWIFDSFYQEKDPTRVKKYNNFDLTNSDIENTVNNIVKYIAEQHREKLTYELAPIDKLIEVGIDTKVWPVSKDLFKNKKQFGEFIIPNNVGTIKIGQ
jgi:hypothetical protein